MDAARPDGSTDALRYLEPGSWVVTEAHVRSNGGTPSTVRRKVAVVAKPDGGERAIEESHWATDSFEPTGPARPLGQTDPRSFDQLRPKPQATQPDQVIAVGPKRYVCRVATYPFYDRATGRSTVLTLWRDKSGDTRLPPRTVSINGAEIPLPADALQAELTVEGPGVSTKTQRRVVSLASPLRVNGQALSCVVETTQTRGARDGKPLTLATQEWYCHDLPGERLRTLACGTVDGADVQSETNVLDFHVAKAGGAGATASGATPAGDNSPPTILPSAE